MPSAITFDIILLFFNKLYYDGLSYKPSSSHHFPATSMPSRCYSALLMHIVSIGVTDISPYGKPTFPPWETDIPSVGTIGYPY